MTGIFPSGESRRALEHAAKLARRYDQHARDAAARHNLLVSRAYEDMARGVRHGAKSICDYARLVDGDAT